MPPATKYSLIIQPRCLELSLGLGDAVKTGIGRKLNKVKRFLARRIITQSI
jgi:hypothetical protein